MEGLHPSASGADPERFILTAALACLWWGCDSADPPVPTTITISPASATLRSLGETVQLTATVRDQYGQAMAGVDIAWSGSDTSVATVDSAGLVTAIRNGSLEVTASVGAVFATAQVTVEQRAASVFVIPEAFRLIRLGSVQASAEADDANGHPIPGASFAWRSTGTAVATVDESGLIAATGVGTASVIASVEEVESAVEISVVVPPRVRSVETPSIPTNGGIRSGGGTWELPADEVFTVTLKGRGNPGYDFVRWTEDGATLSTDSAYTMQVAASHRISARFAVNGERGRWGPANTYGDYLFPDTGYESMAWTYIPVVDPPESLREKDLLHYYAYQ